MPDRRDSALIEAAADAARVTDDFVRGVIGLADGEIGDDNQQHSWLQRRLRGRGGQRSVTRGMGALYAHEQLRKAANEADELVVAVHALAEAWTPAGLDAHGRLAALGSTRSRRSCAIRSSPPGRRRCGPCTTGSHARSPSSPRLAP
jgi:hypothetical protein